MSGVTIRSLATISRIGLEKRTFVCVPLTKLLILILKLLFNLGYISGWCIRENICGSANRRQVLVFPRFFCQNPVLKELNIISKPSHRIYLTWKQLARYKTQEKGILVVSTTKGLMIASQAINHKLGGELLFIVR